MDQYIIKEGHRLRLGYTTGSCAAGASKAAVWMLLTGRRLCSVELLTPKGLLLQMPVQDVNVLPESVSCAICKDAGDDADVTDGMLVYARAEKMPAMSDEEGWVSREGSRVLLQGGEGIGRVTRPGLDQPVGEWAINSGPRVQIEAAVEEVCKKYGYPGRIRITLWIPGGRELARKTFNPKLGIEGGISILGTSGIVEPMSEEALLSTIRLEIHTKAAIGQQALLLTPGNYGQEFIQSRLGLSLDHAVKCSNFIGDACIMAWQEGVFRDGILLVGHIGKLVKLGAGQLNTHSKYGDGRMEELARCMELAGYAEPEEDNPIRRCATTEDALSRLIELGQKEQTVRVLMQRMQQTLSKRQHEKGLEGAGTVEILTFSKQHGLVGETAGARKLLGMLR